MKIKCAYSKIYLSAFILSGLLAGCSTTGPKEDYSTNDQFETLNRTSYQFNEKLDQYLLKPIAEPYARHTPSTIKRGITNFFDNIAYPNVILNSFLQGKLGQGLSDSTRFVANSTLGVAGLVDVASSMGLKRHETDLGQTLAKWGVGQGSYLYLPLFGPNTVRNIPDAVTSNFLDPLNYLASTIMLPLMAINLINTRANFLEATNLRDEAAIEPYIFTREAYLQLRNDGNLPIESYDDIFDESEDGSDDGHLSVE